MADMNIFDDTSTEQNSIVSNSGSNMKSQKRRGRQGFASMSPDEQRRIASKGGKAAHAKGTAHEWNSEEAKAAGRKGGQG